MTWLPGFLLLVYTIYVEKLAQPLAKNIPAYNRGCHFHWAYCYIASLNFLPESKT
jgi:hypothetical protein